MASGRPATTYVTRYFTTKKTRRCSYRVALPSEQQVPVKIEGVRLRKSRWIAESKHPNKKYVRIWLGSYATREEASKVYQSKKMEFQEIKVQATTDEDKKLVGDDQEVGSSDHVESNAESSPDDRDVTMKGTDVDDQAMEEVVFDDQGMRAVDFNDQETVTVLKESKAESLFDDRDVAVNIVEFDDQVTKVVDYQAEKSLSRGKVVEQEIGDMLLLQLGPVLIDKYGRILGEFSWMDDHSIISY